MSSKSTLFLTNCCHIYKDVDCDGGVENETLNIDVSYDYEQDLNMISVSLNSDFAFLIRTMLDSLDHNRLDEMCREHYVRNIK